MRGPVIVRRVVLGCNVARDLTPACDQYRITYGATAGLLADIRGFKKENALRKASSVCLGLMSVLHCIRCWFWPC